MLKIIRSNKFLKDLRLAKSRGLNLLLLDDVVNKLASGFKLDTKYRDHPLSGRYNGFRECHVKPDWLLIYRIDKNELMLFLFATGSHSDLF